MTSHLRHALCLALALGAGPVLAQGGASLKSISVPAPSDLNRYVSDEKALVVLGKALFWDVQVSSDSRVACASCHFHAGADHRRQNQLSTTKDPVQPNWTLAPGDFPFAYSFINAGHRAGSAGVLPRHFVNVGRRGEPDAGFDLEDDTYPNLHGLNLRQVTRRNAPSVINSVFTFRTFWDGRASDVFTGRTPLGDEDDGARVLTETGTGLAAVRVRIERAALASQAVGPPIEPAEMSYRGRSWPMLGRKMLTAQPLALQRVATDDSVLGRYANGGGPGLAPAYSYEALVRAAFKPEYWKSSALVDESGTPLGRTLREPGAAGFHRSPEASFYQDEYNFALFFGLAIQAYESTLISDDSPYDRFLDGQQSALSPTEQAGLDMFQRRACASCHVDPELTLSTYSGVFGNAGFKGIGPDAGFFYTGVEPAVNDLGLRGGLFKTPSLRNVELTGPYFHTGSKSNLEQIVDFYTVGGDYGSGVLRRWGPVPYERVALPALMKAFTDDRVRFERAPFDHPELCVATGHVEDGKGPAAADRWAAIPPVGAAGNTVPLQTFEELLLGIGSDGSRAHTLTERCGMF